MLLAQPFEPFKEQHKSKMPFLARCRFASARTKCALQKLRDQVRYISRYEVPNRYMITPPLPPPSQPWPYTCYVSPMMFPPPPPPPLYPPLHPSFGGLVLPYSICVHINSPPCSIPKQPMDRTYQGQDCPFTTESTLYSPTSSIFDDDEKVEEVPIKNRPMDHSRLTRSQSDVVFNRRRPSF
jgi:hypothetical protein